MDENGIQYDSRLDTIEHIANVRKYLLGVIQEISQRAINHDKTKLESDEKDVFDIYTPKLKESVYGSDDYKKFLDEMKPALDHHYANNSHHPEHYDNGIQGFTLIDLVEMFCDWYAATKRHDTGDITKSIEMNQERFGYSDDVKQILLNTVPFILNIDNLEVRESRLKFLKLKRGD